MRRFVTQLRVRHYEMDALGHVNNAVYQHYLEQAAVEHSEQLGWSMQRYLAVGGVFVLRRITIDYLRPAVAGDRLEVATWIMELRGPRAMRGYQISRPADGATLLTAEGLWVWIELATQRPRSIPRELLDVLAAAA